MWSIGVVIYLLLNGSKSGIPHSVLSANPNFDCSSEAKHFVKRPLNKDHRKRMTAAQALDHPLLQPAN
ncbi:hypothetical protein SLA2020_155900 [Shorea laevis]